MHPKYSIVYTQAKGMPYALARGVDGVVTTRRVPDSGFCGVIDRGHYFKTVSKLVGCSAVSYVL